MKKYSISEMAELVSTDRTNIARYIQRHNLKETNEDRPHKNSPKYFDKEVFERIKEEYTPQKAQQESQKSDTACYSEVEQLLKEQLEYERRDKQKLQEQNTELLKLLNQQQQLTLLSNQKIDTLELELEEVEESEENQEEKTVNKQPNKRRKWYHFFRK